MKILIIGKKNHLHWVENIRDAFFYLDYKTDTIFTNEVSNFINLKKNMLKLFSKDKANQYLSDYIYNQINKINPNLIIVISPFLLPKEISNVLNHYQKAIKIGWVGDKFDKSSIDLSKCYDHLFFTDSHFVKQSNKYAFEHNSYLPLAFNNKIFNNIDIPQIKKNKLLFIGGLTNNRVNLINSASDVIKTKIIGKSFKAAKLNKSIELINKNINITDVSTEYKNSEFILNIKHETNVVNGLNMRTFESIASGACLVQDYLKDLEINFDIEKEMLVYNSKEELSELLIRYSKDKKEIKKILTCGIKNVTANHQYVNRARSILDILGM